MMVVIKNVDYTKWIYLFDGKVFQKITIVAIAQSELTIIAAAFKTNLLDVCVCACIRGYKEKKSTHYC